MSERYMVSSEPTQALCRDNAPFSADVQRLSGLTHRDLEKKPGQAPLLG